MGPAAMPRAANGILDPNELHSPHIVAWADEGTIETICWADRVKGTQYAHQCVNLTASPLGLCHEHMKEIVGRWKP